MLSSSIFSFAEEDNEDKYLILGYLTRTSGKFEFHQRLKRELLPGEKIFMNFIR